MMDSPLVNDSEILEVETECQVPLHVTFHDAENDCYLVGEDVRCSYKILASLELNSYDWVGLFKAGSTLPSEYLYYEWSPLPKDYVKGTDVENAVVFPGRRMPTDDGRLYQFSYISADRKLCGTSKPFGFKVRMSDEKKEKEHMEDGELVVIQTKTSTLEAKIGEETEENVTLKEKLDQADDAKDGLLKKQNQLEEELSQEKEQIEQLKSKLQEKKKMMEELSDNSVYIDIMQSEIQMLTDSRNALMEKADRVEEENRQFQASTFVSLMVLNDRLREADQVKAELEKRLVEEIATSARTMKLAEKLKEELLRYVPGKENKIAQKERSELRKCVAEHATASLNANKVAAELKEQLQNQLSEREQEKKTTETVKADLEKRLAEEMTSSQSSKKLVDELKEQLEKHLSEKDQEMKAFEKTKAELEKCLSEEIAASGRVKRHISLLFFELMALKDENAKLQRQISEGTTKTEEKQQLSDIQESQLSKIEQEKKVVEQMNEYLSKFCSKEHVTRVDVSQLLKDCEERLQKNLLSEKEGETTEAAKDKNAELEKGEMAKSVDTTKTVQELFLEKEQELTAAEKEMAKHEKRLSAEVDSSVHWESLAQQRANDATLMIEGFEKNRTHVESCQASERAHRDLFGTEFSSKMKDLKKRLSERMMTVDMAEEMAEKSERRLLKLKADFEDYLSNKMACSERVKRVLNEERSEREHEQRTTKDLKLELETCLTDAEQTSLAYKQCNQDFSTHVTAYDRDTELKNATQQVLLEKQALIDQREDLKNKIHAEMQNKQLEMVQSCFRKTKEIKRNIEESVVSDFHEEGLRSDRNNLGSSELQQTNDDDLSFDSVDIKMCPVYNTHIFCKPGTTAFLEHLTAHPFHAN